jgi:hypothetical protein
MVEGESTSTRRRALSVDRALSGLRVNEDIGKTHTAVTRLDSEIALDNVEALALQTSRQRDHHIRADARVRSRHPRHHDDSPVRELIFALLVLEPVEELSLIHADIGADVHRRLPGGSCRHII